MALFLVVLAHLATAAAVGAVFWLVWVWLKRPLTNAPGDPALPLLGNVLQFRNPAIIFQTFKRMHNLYGPTIRAYIGPLLYVGVSHPHDVEQILGSTKVTDRDPYLIGIMGEFLGQGLITSRGETWRTHRKIISPTFHAQILEEFLDVFNEGAGTLLNRLGDTQGKRFEVFPVMSLSTLEMIMETAMGSNTDDEEVGHPTKQDIIEVVNRAVRLIQERAVRPWLQMKWLLYLTQIGRDSRHATDVLHRYGDRLVARKVAEVRNGTLPTQMPGEKRRRLAFLDLVVSSENGILTNEEIRDEVYTLIAVGVESTANTMSFALALLSLHPEWQEAVHKELDNVFRWGSEDYYRPVTSRDLSELQMLECVIKETLRMFPIISLMPRYIPSDMVLRSSGYKLPKGTRALVLSYFTHRMPEFFPEPNKFKPDRFLPENTAGRHPYCYVPFSAGLRNCVGGRYAMMQMKTILATVLRRFHVIPVTTMEELHNLGQSVVLHVLKPVQVITKERR